MKYVFIVQYIVHNDRNGIVAQGKIKVKNAESEGDAMNKLRKHLNGLYWDMHKLEMWVLENSTKKEERDWGKVFGDDKFNSIFDNIFGKK